MNLDSKNYYEVLELPHSCTQEDINKSYLRQKNSYSGDSVAMYSLMTQDECEKMLDLIEEAYSILSVPEKRREYDKVRGINNTDQDSPRKKEKQSIIDPHGTKHNQNNSSGNDLMSETFNYQSSASGNDFNFQTDMTSDIPSDFIRHGEHSKKSSVDIPKVSAYKKFSLDYEYNAEFEQEIENCSDFTGEFLKKIREYKNVSIERMADMTRISKTYIRNIEEDNLEKLPAIVYTRGFVFQYAKCLKLNPELVATSYIHHIKKLKAQQ